MRVIDEETGESVYLMGTEKLLSDLAEHRKQFNCPHDQTELRESVLRNGAIHIRPQCLSCGALTGQSVSRVKAGANVPSVDPTKKKEFTEKQTTAYAEIIQRHIKIQGDKDARFTKNYRDHLASSLWRNTTGKVMKRAGFLCEGCRERPAQHIHYLTYQNLGRELLFELVAVCKPCHYNIHANDPVELADEILVWEWN